MFLVLTGLEINLLKDKKEKRKRQQNRKKKKAETYDNIRIQ